MKKSGLMMRELGVYGRLVFCPPFLAQVRAHLQLRFAKGEISKSEYEEMKQVLEKK
jgi:hypothetical protein